MSILGYSGDKIKGATIGYTKIEGTTCVSLKAILNKPNNWRYQQIRNAPSIFAFWNVDQCNDQDKQIRDAPSIFAFQIVNQIIDKVNSYLCNHIRDLFDVDCYDPTNNNDNAIRYDANISEKYIGLMIESSI